MQNTEIFPNQAWTFSQQSVKIRQLPTLHLRLQKKDGLFIVNLNKQEGKIASVRANYPQSFSEMNKNSRFEVILLLIDF